MPLNQKSIYNKSRNITTGRRSSSQLQTTRAKTRLQQQKKKKQIGKNTAVKGAENRLKNFRQASILAVAITGIILMLFSPSEAGLAQDTTQPEEGYDTVAVIEEVSVEDLIASEATTSDSLDTASSNEATDEAIGALQGMWSSFYYNLPKILIAIITLVITWLVARLLRMLFQRVLSRWHSSSAIISLVNIVVWLFGIGIAFSIVAGDIRALIGSFGLIGLALSWSLQTPIESFTGWLLNSFQGYYRVGDRIRVGDVFGDVYRIDFLTTTVWEIGAPYLSGFVQAEQPTGRLVTFPNNEILSGTVINLTRDFPYVWDELSVAVANESNMQLSMQVLEKVALNLLGNYMEQPALQYSQLLKKANLDDFVNEKPQIFLSMDDSWTNLTIRYLVGARERRKWKSELTLRISEELAKPEYLNKIIPVYPRQQVQFINPNGVPAEIKSFGNEDE